MIWRLVLTKYDELHLWYDSLNEVEQLAVDYWLETGDASLVLSFRDGSERLQRFTYVSFVECPVKLFP